jgi:hypothetical protein
VLGSFAIFLLILLTRIMLWYERTFHFFGDLIRYRLFVFGYSLISLDKSPWIVYPSLLASFHPELVIENSCHVSFSFLFPLFLRGYYISSLFLLFGNGMAITLSERQSHMLSPSSIRRLFDNFPFFILWSSLFVFVFIIFIRGFSYLRIKLTNKQINTAATALASVKTICRLNNNFEMQRYYIKTSCVVVLFSLPNK